MLYSSQNGTWDHSRPFTAVAVVVGHLPPLLAIYRHKAIYLCPRRHKVYFVLLHLLVVDSLGGGQSSQAPCFSYLFSLAEPRLLVVLKNRPGTIAIQDLCSLQPTA